MPPLVVSEKLTGFMMSGSDSTHSEGANAGAEALRFFKTKIRQFEDVFAAQFPVSRLRLLSRILAMGMSALMMSCLPTSAAA